MPRDGIIERRAFSIVINRAFCLCRIFTLADEHGPAAGIEKGDDTFRDLFRGSVGRQALPYVPTRAFPGAG